MAKRGGGRGGSRGGSRGGHGNGGRFQLSKTQKRKNKGKAVARKGTDMPELMDLSDNVYIPEMGTLVPQGSMRNLSRRPNRHMVDEARYTDKNVERTMKEPLRNRPILFVKAQKVYDPSKDLIELLRKKPEEDISESLQLLNMEEGAKNDEVKREEPTYEIHSSGEVPASKNLVEEEEEIEETDLILDDSEKQDFPEVANVVPEIVDNDGIVQDDDEDEEATQELLDSAPESIEVPELKRVEDLQIITEVEESRIVDSDESEFEEEEDMFLIDESGDNTFLEKHGVEKLTTKTVISQGIQRDAQRRINESSPIITSDQPKAFLEYEPYVTVGKVMMRTRIIEDGTTEARLATHAHLKEVTQNGFVESTPSSSEESEDSDEEAAFEDYMAQIMQANELDSDDDSDDESSTEISEAPEMDDYEAVYASDEDASALDAYIDDFDGSDNEEEDGLQDIISFARLQQKSFADMDIPATKGPKIKGKGKNLRIVFQEGLEMELRESLLEQFHYQKASRRDKKIRKKARRQQEGLQNNDLNVKYDYSIHVKEINQELEEFLHDAERESLSFPPLDAHGNKTINKLASHYNMKCTRSGAGLHTYMKVSKTRKTFHYLPRHDLIAYILKQRPIFKRADVKQRTKEEMGMTDGKKVYEKSNAHVKDGDIVGAEAPEIGKSNIGRQLLEKLGWVQGEGLGAHGNKGISIPLMATVKNTKAGLK